MVCAFLGHRDTPSDIIPLLRETLIHLIAERGVTTFYVGNQGSFDHLAIRTLSELKNIFLHISITVVLPYLPTKRLFLPSNVESLFPAEAATAPPRYAIDRVNRWMISHADIFVTYITRSQGCAATYVRAAVKAKKEIISLSGGNRPPD